MKQASLISFLLLLPCRSAIGDEAIQIPEDAVYVVFSGPINDTRIGNLNNAVLRARENHPGKDIVIFIDSYGGKVEAALNGYNLIRNLEVNVWTINTGLVHSIATTLFLAGDRRLCQPGADFGFHGVTWPNEGLPLYRTTTEGIAESIARDESRISAVFQDRTRLTGPDIRELQGRHMTTRDCSWAIETGFAHGKSAPPPLIPDGKMVYWAL